MAGTSIYAKLRQIQGKIEVPKAQYNEFGKYYYRSAEDVLRAAKPLLDEAGCILLLTDDVINKDSRYYVKAISKLIDCDTGEEIEVSAEAREEESKKGMDGAQVTGSSSSYARKYALNGLFLLDDGRDPDSTNKHENGKNSNQQSGNNLNQSQNKGGKNSNQNTDKNRQAALKALQGVVDKRNLSNDTVKQKAFELHNVESVKQMDTQAIYKFTKELDELFEQEGAV